MQFYDPRFSCKGGPGAKFDRFSRLTANAFLLPPTFKTSKSNSERDTN